MKKIFFYVALIFFTTTALANGGNEDSPGHCSDGDCMMGSENWNFWRGGEGHMNGMMSGWGGMFFGLGWIISLLFWVLVILGIAALIRQLAGGRFKHGCDNWLGKSKTPLEILRERYAKGELDKAEYEKMKKDLNE